MSDLIPGLPPWMYMVANGIALFVLSVVGIAQMLKTRGETKGAVAAPAAATASPDHFDPDELLGSGPVVRFLANVEEVAVNARLQTEALRNLSAVATLVGKRLEDGYSELVVFKAVHEALAEERRHRGRGDRGSGGWGGSS